MEETKVLCRDYFEVYRIEAWLNIVSGLFSEARSGYELAISLAPDYAPIRLWFAGFLLRYCSGELKLALQHLHKGKSRDPEAVEFDLKIVRTKLYQREYEAAQRGISTLLRNEEISEWNGRESYHLLVQLHKRKGEMYVKQKEYMNGCQAFKALRECYMACPKPFLDEKNESVISSCIPAVRLLKYVLPKTARGEFDQELAFFWKALAVGTVTEAFSWRNGSSVAGFGR